METARDLILQIRKQTPEARSESQNTARLFDFEQRSDVFELHWNLFLALANKFSLKFYQRPFEVDKYNEHQYKMMFIYFCGLESWCRAKGMDIRKGLFLIGNPGCGKTYALRLFSYLLSHPFRIKQQDGNSIEYWDLPPQREPGFEIVMCDDLVKNVFSQHTQEAFALIKKYSGHLNEYDINPQAYCFDDLGREVCNINYWGTKLNLMSSILVSRNDLWVNHGIKTYATTNLDEDMIADSYNDSSKDIDRISCRVKEMANVIYFPSNAPNRRQ